MIGESGSRAVKKELIRRSTLTKLLPKALKGKMNVAVMLDPAHLGSLGSTLQACKALINGCRA